VWTHPPLVPTRHRCSGPPSCLHVRVTRARRFTDGHRVEAKDINASVGATVKAGDAGVYTVDVDALAGPNFEFTGLVNYQKFLVGGSAKVNTTFLAENPSAAGAASLADVGALVGYKTSDFTVAAQSKGFFSGVGLSLFHKASDTVTAGASVAFPVSGDKPFVRLALLACVAPRCGTGVYSWVCVFVCGRGGGRAWWTSFVVLACLRWDVL
jgi:hypothetical protein